ncbi:MAG: hypothetical protein HDT39_15745 [Lachnospiraceae bacterium]|nr:hypothetical protein [Lachnospiraceae bacterium]
MEFNIAEDNQKDLGRQAECRKKIKTLAEDAGMNEHIAKPLDLKILDSVLKRLM